MPASFSTEAAVLGSHKLRDADRIVTLFTSGFGRVPVVVKGVRKVKSRFGGRLEPFTQLNVQLCKGRSLHTLTGADTIKTRSAARGHPAALKAGFSFINLLGRETNELENRPRTYNLLTRFLDGLDESVKSGAGEKCFAFLALAADLKLLLLAGYLPSLTSCAACSADEKDLTRFSAAAGGVLCADCPGESFPITDASLAEMRRLLERPLAQACADPPGMTVAAGIWQAIREICRFHLGVDLKVQPW